MEGDASGAHLVVEEAESEWHSMSFSGDTCALSSVSAAEIRK